jgi:hypothetical protein
MIRRIRAIVCLLVLVAGLSGCHSASTLRSNEQAQKELVAFLGGLQAGMSPSSVEELFKRGQYQKLSLSGSAKDKPPGFVVSTPPMWGAGNWIAYIDFERDVISTVKVRTLDSAEDRPDAAPPDRTFRP